MSDFDALMIYVSVAAVLPILLAVLSRLLSKRKPSEAKEMTYECGQPPLQESVAAPFSMEYFPYAIIYIAYAVLAILVFISVQASIDSPNAMPRVALFLLITSLLSMYVGATLPELTQKV